MYQRNYTYITPAVFIALLLKMTLRQAAKLLNLSQIKTMNLFLDKGIKGNLDASDVLVSLERFVFKEIKNGKITYKEEFGEVFIIQLLV